MYDVKRKYGGRDKYRSGHGGTRWEDEMEMEIVSGTPAGSRELAVGTHLTGYSLAPINNACNSLLLLLQLTTVFRATVVYCKHLDVYSNNKTCNEPPFPHKIQYTFGISFIKTNISLSAIVSQTLSYIEISLVATVTTCEKALISPTPTEAKDIEHHCLTAL